MIRSPVVVSSLVGLALCGILYATGAELPEWIEGTMKELSKTFTGTALVTLGLAAHAARCAPRPPALYPLPPLRQIPPRAAAESPLRRRARTRDRSKRVRRGGGASRAFAFVYGALPPAPTVVVFAREYGEKTSFLATLQMLVLIVTVPFILGSVVVIENPLLKREPTALILLVDSVAVVGAVVSGYFVVALSSSLLVRCRDTATTAINMEERRLDSPPALLAPRRGPHRRNTLHERGTRRALGGGAETHGFATWRRSWSEIHCLRVQLAIVSMLMARQACPVRSKPGARRRRWREDSSATVDGGSLVPSRPL